MAWFGKLPQSRVDVRTRRFTQRLGRFDLLLGNSLTINDDGKLDISLGSPTHGIHLEIADDGLIIKDDYLFNTGDTCNGDLDIQGHFRVGITGVTTDYNVNFYGSFIGPDEYSFNWTAAGGRLAVGRETSAGPGSFAAGNHTDASGSHAMAVGDTAIASGNESVALGDNTLASASRSFAGGRDTVASGYASVAIGYNTTASGYCAAGLGQTNTIAGDNAFAAGSNNTASGNSSVTLGHLGVAAGAGAFALGSACEALNEHAISLGRQCVSSGVESVCIGRECTVAVGGDKAIAMGYLTAITATGSYSFVSGYGTSSSGLGGFVGGYQSSVTANYGAALGYQCVASGAYATAMGGNATASGARSVSLGWTGTASGAGSVSLGRENVPAGAYSVAAGQSCTTEAAATASVALGYQSKTKVGVRGVAIGDRCEAQSGYAGAMGVLAKANGMGAIAIGFNLTATGDYTQSYGKNITNTGTSSIVIGNGLTVTTNNVVVLGFTRNLIQMKNWEVAINEDSYDVNFRVEGNAIANLIKADAGLDRVGINATNPLARFHVVGDTFLGAAATNYAEFKNDGELNLHGTARVTKLLPITRLFSNAGVDVIDSCHYVYDLDPIADEGVAFITYVPNDHAAGTNVIIKFRWCPTVTNSDGVDRYVYWRGYYHTTGSSGTIGAGTAVASFSSTVPNGEVAETIHENTFATISGLSAGDALHFIIYRDADHASDDYSADVAFWRNCFMEYTADRLGETT